MKDFKMTEMRERCRLEGLTEEGANQLIEAVVCARNRCFKLNVPDTVAFFWYCWERKYDPSRLRPEELAQAAREILKGECQLGAEGYEFIVHRSADHDLEYANDKGCRLTLLANGEEVFAGDYETHEALYSIGRVLAFREGPWIEALARQRERVYESINSEEAGVRERTLIGSTPSVDEVRRRFGL